LWSYDERVVANLHVLKPCPESWDQMSGGGRLRQCDACNKDVHDLRGMSDAEALAYVRARNTASMCVRMLVVTTAVAACGAGAPPPPPAVAPVASTASQPVARAELPAPEVTDKDKDGIPDGTDACPTEPGQPSGDAHKNGCPQLIVMESMGDLIVLEQVHFHRGSRTVLAESFPMIDETIKVLKNTPAIRQIAIEGHASPDEPSAQELSEARAKAVVARMVAAGVEPKRLVARGYGAARPIEENKTAEGRARNRRVEFRIVDEAEASASRDASCPPGPPSSPAP
jgi:outer membrane protein OmpA-like peptidoglycan-associated protein